MYVYKLYVLQGFSGGDDGRIFFGAQDYTAWVSGRGKTELENLSHGGIAVDVSHGLPDQGRPADLPGEGLLRTSGDEDRDAGPFSTLAYPGHRGNFDGGKPTPPMVPPMRYSGTLVYTE